MLLLGTAAPILLSRAPWVELGRGLWNTPLSYQSARQAQGFGGLPIAELRVRIDQRVPDQTPLSLDETLSGDPFLAQRLVEGLYPRRLHPEAELRLALLPLTETRATPLDVPGYLVAHPSGGHFVLVGPLPDVPQAVRTARPAERSNHTQRFTWWRFLVQTLALFGWGTFFLACFPRRVRALWSQADLPAATAARGLAGLLLLALSFCVATWIGYALPRLLPSAGVVPALVTLAHGLRKRKLPTTLRGFAPVLPVLLVALVTLFLAAHAFGTPVIGWDGRSIWFFRAHMLAHEGHFSHTDYTNPVAAFSNPDYPLLFPALLAHMGLPGPWNERQASGGLALGLGLVLLGLWSVLRPILGRLAAAFVLVVYIFSNFVLLSRGYPDALLAGLLVIGLLGCLRSENRLIGFLALACAALCKREGLFLGTGIALAVIALPGQTDPRGENASPHPSRLARRLRLALALTAALLPGFAHLAWSRITALPDPFRGAALPDAPELALRLRALFSAYAALLTSTPVHLLGAAGFLVLLGACLAPRLRRQANAPLFLAVSLMAFGFALAVFIVTPLPFAWHVATAFSRLAAHAAWLSATGAAWVLAPAIGNPRMPA